MAFLSNSGTRQHPTQGLLGHSGGYKMEGCCRKEIGARELLTKEKKPVSLGQDIFFFFFEGEAGKGFIMQVAS